MRVDSFRTQVCCLIALTILILDQVGKSYGNTPIASCPQGLTLSLSAKQPKLRPDGQFNVATFQELIEIFKDFDIAKVDSVPRLYLAKFPKDIKKHKKRSSKSAFIQVLLPHVLKINANILVSRERLLALQDIQMKGKKLTPADKLWLNKLASQYRCSSKIRTLLHHVDIVPPSLALAQGAIESGWGTSRAARMVNSTFGHMKTKTKIEPFKTLLHNVEAYILNLNRHQAYSGFRSTRARLRRDGEIPNGPVLASELKKYSVRGTGYTSDLKNIISRHKLEKYDKASFAPSHAL